ncbi:MAG: hypothetical protein C5B51_12000 [Terriglobia bacterium]|nr:MAG: hypothetical protein C5B51_12000 [Terriglobia bacterium]
MPTRSKLSTGLYLVVVFVSGALVGGLSYRLYSVNTVTAVTGGLPKTSPEEFRRRYIEAIRAKVHLDPQQIDQVNRIMDETRTQFDDARARSRAEMQAIEARRVEKMNAILRDDQKSAYTEFRAEREKLRQQQREKQQR